MDNHGLGRLERRDFIYMPSSNLETLPKVLVVVAVPPGCLSVPEWVAHLEACAQAKAADLQRTKEFSHRIVSGNTCFA